MSKQQTQESIYTESYPDQICKLYSFKEEKARYRKHYLPWDKIKRANKKVKPVRQKSFFLSDKAGKLLSIIVAKLQKGERVFLNHKYISTFTFVERRQNIRIIQELANILDITYHNSITHNGKKYRFSYEFSYKKKNIENTASPENSIATFMSQQNDSLYIYNKNKDIEDIDLESKFLQYSKEIKIEETSEPKVTILFQEPVKTSKLKTRLPNERKKPIKARAKVYKPFAFDKPKPLADMLPLIDRATCDELRYKSGRHFSDNFIIQLVLKMSKNPKITARFDYKTGFIAYMARALYYELHDAVKTGNINFRLKANIPSNNNKTLEQKKPPEPLELPEGIWGDICHRLIDIYDEHVYRNWLSKLTVFFDEDDKFITLVAPSSFIQQWIETNYGDVVLKVTKSLGLKFKGIIQDR